MKQTAVEWLIENSHIIPKNELNKRELIKQAKAMEKEQIVEAWIATDNELQRISAEQYYNETFKSE